MLYIVASPIGNLEDITLRALRILKEVAYIACEDTRQTKKLLTKYDIDTKCISCHSHNQKYIFQDKLLPLLQEGKDIALVSDAGTPCISDPGAEVVELAREHNIDVCPIPGVSAITTILSIAGLHGKGFLFEGFLQRKSGARRKKLEYLLQIDSASLIFESPYRISKILSEICAIDPNRQVLLGREMTKKFEQFRKDSAQTILQEWNNTQNETAKAKIVAKGECTLLIYPKVSSTEPRKKKNKYL